MAEQRILPAHVLAGYIWALWQANAGVEPITGKDGRKIARIAPIGDTPDLADSGETYIIYGFAENENPRLPVHHMGQFAMRIMAKDFAEMTSLIRLIESVFELEDEAAKNINWWSAVHPGYDGIMFTSVCVNYLEASEPPTTEGGRIEGMMSLSYRFMQDYIPPKVYSSTGWRELS